MKKAIFIFMILVIFVLIPFVKAKDTPSYEKYASKIFNKCSLRSDKNVCYETEIPKLVKTIGMSEVFKISSMIQERDNNFSYCHVLGHNIASEETSKDPSKWKDVVASCPAGVCSNGCIHGAFQERFRRENASKEDLPNIENEITDICENRDGFDPSSLEKASCYHALGHLLMYVTSADTNTSIQMCKRISSKPNGMDFSGVCFDGVFMQMFQPLDTDDEALVYGKVPEKSEVLNYCNQFSGEAKYSCWNESWPVFLNEIMAPGGIDEFCSKMDSTGRKQCISDTLYILPVIFQFDKNSMADFCNSMPAIRSECFSTFANRILEIDYKNKQESIDFCMNMSNTNDQNLCIQKLVDYAKFVFKSGSDNLLNFCSLIPQSLKDNCLLE